MDAKRIYFRTRGGRTHGWGNIFRLGSFAEWCRDQGHTDLTFFVEGPSEVFDYLEERNFRVVRLPEDVSLEDEEHALHEFGSADVTFVEMLDVTPERQALLARHSSKLVIFDDLCDHTYQADLVVCGQDLPSHSNRMLSDARTEFLVGYEYFLCRPEFLPYATRERHWAAELNSILVTLGGGRYDVGYLKSAHAIAACRQAFDVTFVLGFDDRPDLEAGIRSILPEATILGGVADLEQRMWNADLVIASAGYTKLEAAITGTPSIVMSAQWHQIPLAHVFAERTGTRDLGYVSYVVPEELTATIESMAPVEARRDLAKRARRVVDGRGFERVYQAAFGDAV